MSIGYKISKENTDDSFDYGSLEDKIGFLSDNYYEAMKIYRTIVKQEKEADKKREKAHRDLQKIRADEERWQKQNKVPQGFDAEEHEKRKTYLAALREEEFDIIYKNQPLQHDKLTCFIIERMWLFKILDKLDMRGRKRLGPLASKVLSIIIWPQMKMMEREAKENDSLEAEKFIKKQIKFLKSVPKKVRDKIINVNV
jgi:hypothetical protein